jgi:hypothetical protein
MGRKESNRPETEIGGAPFRDTGPGNVERQVPSGRVKAPLVPLWGLRHITAAPEPERRIPWRRLHLDGLDRYHGAGALVVTAGSIGMLAAACLALGPLWVGFLAGALPTFMLTTLVHPEHA